MPTAAPRLAVRGLAVRRGKRSVLEGLDFEVAAGEIFGLLGPNGAGKTTAFQVLTGLLAPREGRFELDGRPLPPGDRALRSAMGVVFQEPALDRRLTARENLALAARLHGVPRSEAPARIDRAIADADLAERDREPVSRFSGGMRRRLEIARALLHAPSILVLDEPTTGLDEAAFRRTWGQIEGLRRSRGLTVLVTTHRPEEAERCDRLAVLDGGRLVACDTPDALRGRVHGDLVLLECDDPTTVAQHLSAAGLEPRIVDHRVVLERERAHELVPRLVELVPAGSLRAVSVRRAGLGEAFLELTGHDLAGERERGGA